MSQQCTPLSRLTRAIFSRTVPSVGLHGFFCCGRLTTVDGLVGVDLTLVQLVARPCFVEQLASCWLARLGHDATD